MMCTVYDTNAYNYQGAANLIILRSAFFLIMLWVTILDVKHQHAQGYDIYSLVTEITSLSLFFLLVLCSIQKYVREIYYNQQ